MRAFSDIADSNGKWSVGVYDWCQKMAFFKRILMAQDVVPL